MKPAGGSTPTCSGSGRMSPPRPPSTRSNPAGGSPRRRTVIGARLSRRAAARRLAVVSLLHGGAASDLSGASAATLSDLALGLSGPAVCGARSKPFCRPPSRRGKLYRAGAVSAARARRGPRPLHSSASAGCSNARPVAGLAVRRFQQHLIVEFTPSSAFSSTRPSTPPTGALNRRCGPRSSPAKCAAAAIAPPRRGHASKSSPVSCARPISAASMPPICWSRCSPRPRPSCRRASQLPAIH